MRLRPFSRWTDRQRLDLLASPETWADVMVSADALHADYGDAALHEADARAARGDGRYWKFVRAALTSRR